MQAAKTKEPHLSTRGHDTSRRVLNPLSPTEAVTQAPPTRRHVLPKTLQENAEENERDVMKASRGQTKINAIGMLKAPLLTRALTMLDDHDLVLAEDESIDIACWEIAADTERAVYRNCYKTAKPLPEYTNKIRSIAFNLKKNPSLAREVVWGGISPTKLAEMSSEEMASKELKEFMEKVRIQSEINVTLVNWVGPRFRKTHKGDELVEDPWRPSRTPVPGDSVVTAGDSLSSQSSSKTAEGDVQPKDHAMPNKMEVFGSARHRSSLAALRSRVQPVSPKTGNVWDFHAKPSSRSHCDNSPPHSPAAIEDDRTNEETLEAAEVWAVMNSEADNHENTAMEERKKPEWVGRIEINNVASFCAIPHLVGGPEYISGVKWIELLDEVLQIDGGTSPAMVGSYLQTIGSSKSTTIFMVYLAPLDNNDKVEMQKLYRYSKRTNDSGVVRRHSHKCIRSVHLMFMEGHDPLPAWFSSLEPPYRFVGSTPTGPMLFAVCGITHKLVKPLLAPTDTTQIQQNRAPKEQGQQQMFGGSAPNPSTPKPLDMGPNYIIISDDSSPGGVEIGSSSPMIVEEVEYNSDPMQVED